MIHLQLYLQWSRPHTHLCTAGGVGPAWPWPAPAHHACCCECYHPRGCLTSGLADTWAEDTHATMSPFWDKPSEHRALSVCMHARGCCATFNSSQQQVLFLSQWWDLNCRKFPAPRQTCWSSTAGYQDQGQEAFTQTSLPSSSRANTPPLPVFVTVLVPGTSWEGDPAVCPVSGSCAHSHWNRH